MMAKKKVRRVDQIAASPEQRRKEFYERVDRGDLDLRQTVIEYRYLLGKTQPEFARFAKIPLKTLRDFEQDKGNPTLKTIEKMLRGSGLEITARKKI
jgi:DNA-binding XRE family transcriptional regulator